METHSQYWWLFVRGIHPLWADSSHKGSIIREAFPIESIAENWIHFWGTINSNLTKGHFYALLIGKHIIPLHGTNCCDSLYMKQNMPTLQWRNNWRDGVSNHQPHDCLLNRLFCRRSTNPSKLRVTGLCEENSPVTGEFPAQGPMTPKMFPIDDVIMPCQMGFIINVPADKKAMKPEPGVFHNTWRAPQICFWCTSFYRGGKQHS